ncbi:MAG: hypothetical protein ACYCPW_00150 [Nitrososphaerales archaeon]
MPSQEMILAQEQSVLSKSGFGKEIQGTLVLTDRRLLFVSATAEDTPAIGLNAVRYYSDVEDLDSVGQNPSNISIPLGSVLITKGHAGLMTSPNLKIKYKEGSSEKNAEFIQKITGGRKKNLNDWSKIIEDLQNGKIKIKIPSWLPDKDSLESRIIDTLSDLQEKGIFEIEKEIETKYKIDLDPDQVETACNNLVSKGILEKKAEDFYRLPSPLGIDDLSS